MSYAGNTTVELRKPRKSTFDLSHQKRLSTRMGRLTPVLTLECLPGDKFSGSSEILLRLAPLLAPIYDQIILYVHFFFVPYRLLWSESETFFTGGRLGTGVEPVTAPIPPYADLKKLIDGGYIAESLLADYLGVPIVPLVGETAADYDGLTIDVMPFLAYARCYSDYYRDRNYNDDDALVFPVGSGELDPTTGQNSNYFDLYTRDWMKNYFTAALPFTQRGVEVLMPLAGTGTVSYLDTSEIYQADGTPAAPDTLVGRRSTGIATMGVNKANAADTGDLGRIENIDEVEITSSNVSINDFRTAYALQTWLERNAVGGSRYTEVIQAHFAVRPQDSRLQRAEYIGGGRIPVKISEVVNTAFSQNQDDDTIPAGNLAGHGVTYGNTNRFNYFCTEHGMIMGIMSIMNPPSYYQGLPRMFKRKTVFDYAWPLLANLGEQEVKKYELYMNAVNLTENSEGEEPMFGYQSRYADWKQVQSSNHGAFRTTLRFWTLTNHYASSPTLGNTFVNYDQTLQDNIFAVNGTEDNFWCYISNAVKVNRALPYFGTPSIIQ